MVEPLINHWTIDHFFFGLFITFIISFLSRSKYPISSISLLILVLWEMFEYREWPHFWVINYRNNIMDVVVGFFAVIVGVKSIRMISAYYHRKKDPLGF